jgi:hypothetical protein
MDCAQCFLRRSTRNETPSDLEHQAYALNKKTYDKTLLLVLEYQF